MPQTIHLIHWLFLTCAFLIQIDGIYPQTRRILPADSYQILGQPAFRQLGLCNITYAWLKPPPASSLDAYGHALACARLELQDGKIAQGTLDQSMDPSSSGSSPEDELRGINKELTASMVDINGLDTLMKAEQLGGSRSMTFTGQQLADGQRYFFLADRIGTLNILVLLRPEQELKLQLIDPMSTDHMFTPQHVLCSRQQCPPVKTPLIPVSTTGVIKSDTMEIVNNSRAIAAALSVAKQANRDIYTQLVISRVACALLSFLCVVFAITALALCIRLRRNPSLYHKRAAPSELSVCREPHPSPSYYQRNGKIGGLSPTPHLMMSDASPRHVGGLPSHLPSDNASVSNMVMTASNLSECGGMGGASISYALSSPYGPMSAYPINTGHGTVYSVLLPYQNGSTSPAPSNHSMNEPKAGIVRTGSLGRYSGASIQSNMENGRRKLPRLARPIPMTRHSDIHMENGDHVGHYNGDHPMGHMAYNGLSNNHPNDLISFQQGSVVHRYPGEGHRVPTPCGSINGTDRHSVKSNLQMNHVNEPSVAGLVRKPAVGN